MAQHRVFRRPRRAWQRSLRLRDLHAGKRCAHAHADTHANGTGDTHRDRVRIADAYQHAVTAWTCHATRANTSPAGTRDATRANSSPARA